MHGKLLKIIRTLEADYEPYGKVERDSSDCSCGCHHFVKICWRRWRGIGRMRQSRISKSWTAYV
jgi:hypothetical protein